MQEACIQISGNTIGSNATEVSGRIQNCAQRLWLSPWPQGLSLLIAHRRQEHRKKGAAKGSDHPAFDLSFVC